MRQADNEILRRLRTVTISVAQRTLLLSDAHDDVNVFAEGLRDIGNDLYDTAQAALTRVADIDATDGVPNGKQTARAADTSDMLAMLADKLRHELAAGSEWLPAADTAATSARHEPQRP